MCVGVVHWLLAKAGEAKVVAVLLHSHEYCLVAFACWLAAQGQGAGEGTLPLIVSLGAAVAAGPNPSPIFPKYNKNLS